ncbi:MAG TPA: 6-phosphofructokinase [Candidatus Kapabacteria bacterium]|nr:6-phosphofructokinase [Candidatus Kapabacteria bacterium]
MVKKVAILTSGGDAPGMNAAIRAAVRMGCANGLEMYGVRYGYQGLIDNEIFAMNARSVGGIIQQGGTILGSARSLEFKTDEGRKKALTNLASHGIEGLIVIGGNGSQTGSHALHQLGFPVVGIASTIDNDLYGSEITIGVDTALNIALEAIDRLKVTASSHQRAFLVEVMGRDSGYLAMMAGIAGGAETVVIPEVDTDPNAVAQELIDAYSRGKTHGLVVVAEGARYDAEKLAAFLKEKPNGVGFDVRVTTLGHVQRGGTPQAFDRLLATQFGVKAVECMIAGEYGVLVGRVKGSIATTPLEVVIANKKELDLKIYEMSKVLAT